MTKSLIDNYDFELFGQGTKAPWRGYVSSIDPTTAGTGVMIGGSQNTYKSILGSVRNRWGLKRRGPADTTIAGVVRSYEWETSLGLTRVLRAVNGKLQVEYDSGSGIEYYDLLTGLTTDELDFSFAPWFSYDLEKDVLIFVNGKQELNMWGGGIVAITTAANSTGIIGDIRGPNYVLSSPLDFSGGGIGYIVGDILTISGGNGDARLEVDSLTTPTAVSGVSIANAGANYTVGDLVKIETGPVVAGDAILKVTAVGGGGAVTGLAIVVNGFDYAVSSSQPTTVVLQTSGTASGLTVNITSVAASIASWHLTNNGSGYSTGSLIATTGGSGTGATIAIENVKTGRATIGGTSTLSQLGFAGTLTSSDSSNSSFGGSFISNGVQYTYSALGDNGFSFVGVSPDPTSLAGNVVVSEVQVTDTSPSAGPPSALEDNFFNDYITVIGNQLYVGCYISRIVHIASIIDYTDFVVPDFRAPGTPDLYILDSNSRGATAKGGQKGNAVLFGSLGDSYSITRNVSTFINAAGTSEFTYENVIVDKATSADLSSPISQNFIDSIGDTIIFVDQNNQLRQFGTLRNLSTPVYPILSLDVYTELAGLDLTGGEMRAVAEQSGDTVYITVPLSAALYLYQIREKVDQVGNLTAERLWQPPFIVGATTIAVIAGITYIYSNANPQMYQLWNTGQYHDDSPSDEPIPYECHQIIAYLSLEDRAQQLYFDKLYYEGYMTRGTNLYNNIYQEYQGSKNLVTVTINKAVAPGKKLAKFYDSTATPALGDVALGQIPLGEGVTAKGGASIPKFRAIRRSTATDIFEFALDIASYGLDDQWEMLTIGVNLQSTTRRPTSIMA